MSRSTSGPMSRSTSGATTGDPGKKLRLEDFLPYRLSILSNRISRAIANSYGQRFGLTIREWRIMAVLGETPNISAGELAERTAIDKVAVSRAVRSLLGRGRLLRRFSTEDRRRSVLRLSKAGERLYDEIAPIAQGYEKSLLARLSANEQRQLDKALTRLMEIQPEVDAEIFSRRGPPATE